MPLIIKLSYKRKEANIIATIVLQMFVIATIASIASIATIASIASIVSIAPYDCLCLPIKAYPLL